MLKNDDIKINFGLVSFWEIIPNHTKRYILFLVKIAHLVFPNYENDTRRSFFIK